MDCSFEPRQAPAGSWKRWLRDSLRLTVRQAPVALPLAVLMGLAGGALARQIGGFGFIAVMAVFGLWQTASLALAEQAAQGQRVHAGHAWAAVRDFGRQPGHPAWHQVRTRALVTTIGFVLIALTVLFFLMVLPREGDPSRPPLPHPIFLAVGAWSTAVVGSWALQRGGLLALANPLVRRHGLDWKNAHALSDRAFERNRRNLQALNLVASSGILLTIFSPFAVFLLEPWWASLVTVVGRDLFDSREGLDPIAAPARGSAQWVGTPGSAARMER